MIASIMQKILEYKTSGSVIDIGTGNGKHAIFLKNKGFDVDVLDIKNENLEQLKNEFNIIEGDITNFNSNKKYDVVLCIMVLHRIENFDAAVENIKKLVKDDGIIVVSTLTDKNKNNSSPHLFKENELKSYFEDYNTLHYWEGLGIPFKDGRRYHRAEIITKLKEVL